MCGIFGSVSNKINPTTAPNSNTSQMFTVKNLTSFLVLLLILCPTRNFNTRFVPAVNNLGNDISNLAVGRVIPMGSPLPPNEPGSDFNLCWGPGKPFGIGFTPHVIKMQLTRIIQGELGNDEFEQNMLVTHLLEQTINPMKFEIYDDRFYWFVEWHPSATLISVRDEITLKHCFVATLPAICQVDAPNEVINWANNFMYGGFANITWDREGLD